MLSIVATGARVTWHGTIISDAHAGLTAARRSMFPSVKWQRYQFHLQQNAQSYTPDQAEAERLIKVFLY